MRDGSPGLRWRCGGKPSVRYLLNADFTTADLIGRHSGSSPNAKAGRSAARPARQAHTTALRVQAFTDDAANTPHQLATGSSHALADLTARRTRWQRATHTPAAPRTPAVPRAGPRLRTTAVSPAIRVSR